MTKKTYTRQQDKDNISYCLLCGQMYEFPLFGWYKCGSTTVYFRYSFVERRIYLDFSEDEISLYQYVDDYDVSEKVIVLQFDETEWLDVWKMFPKVAKNFKFSKDVALKYLGMWKG